MGAIAIDQLEPVGSAACESPHIGTVPRPACYVCGTMGTHLYQELYDRLFGAQGDWSLRQCSNPQCGLLWLDPMPAADELTKLYRHYYTHGSDQASTASLPERIKDGIRSAYWAGRYGYPAADGLSRSALRHIWRLLPGYCAQWDFCVFFLAARPKGRLLEVGCGSGTTLKRMAGFGWQVEGVDFDPKAVAVARREGLDVRVGTVEEQCYDDDTFDAVVMSHVLEHVPDPRALLADCKRILKPGGQLISITPNASSWGHARYSRDWRGLEPPRHLHIFTPKAMRILADDVAFNQCQVSSVVANAPGILLASKHLCQRGRVEPYSESGSGKLWGRTMQLAEWMLLGFNPDCGEEILLRASK